MRLQFNWAFTWLNTINFSTNLLNACIPSGKVFFQRATAGNNFNNIKNFSTSFGHIVAKLSSFLSSSKIFFTFSEYKGHFSNNFPLAFGCVTSKSYRTYSYVIVIYGIIRCSSSIWSIRMLASFFNVLCGRKGKYWINLMWSYQFWAR